MIGDRLAAVLALALWETTATAVEAGVVGDGVGDGDDGDGDWGEGGDADEGTLTEAVGDAVPELLELLELAKVSLAK